MHFSECAQRVTFVDHPGLAIGLSRDVVVNIEAGQVRSFVSSGHNVLGHKESISGDLARVRCT